MPTTQVMAMGGGLILGYVFMLNGGAVSWRSQKQQSVALSTTEAEYMALVAATQEANQAMF